MTVPEKYRLLDYNGNQVELTDSQKKCIDYDSKTALVIKGTAGSGKTFMVVARAIDYLKKIKTAGSDRKIAIFTYNKSLVSMIKDLLAANGIALPDDQLLVMNVDRYITELCKSYGVVPRFDNGYGYRRQGKQWHNVDSPAIGDDKTRVDIVKSVMEELAYGDNSRYYRLDPAFMADEILWMYQNGLVDEDDRQSYLNMSREGRCKRYTVHLGREAREKVFNVFTAYNKKLMEKRRFEWDRIYAIFYRDHISGLDTRKRFDYVLIDEAQDLTLTKMRILKELCKDELSVAMDKNQSIYGHRWSFQRDVKLTPCIKNLKVTFRNSRQIDLLAMDLKKADDSLLDDEDRYDNEVSTKNGPIPMVVHCSSDNSQIEFIVDLVKKLPNDRQTTAILCSEYSSLNLYYERLKLEVPNVQMFKKDEDFSSSKPGIKLMTLYSAKGLGFFNVIIPSFEDGVYPKSAEAIANALRRKAQKRDETEGIDLEEVLNEEAASSRRLAYVGITRAMARLFITYVGKPSPYISEFDPSHYDLVNESLSPITDTRITCSQEITKHDLAPHGSLETFAISDTATVNPEPTMKMERSPNLDSVLNGFETYDRRPSGGVFWVVDAPGLEDLIDRLRKEGYDFKYTKNGSRTTTHRPAYYLER